MGNPLIPSDGVYRLSAHKLNMMRSCPFSLMLYLSHAPEGETEKCWTSCGSAVHAYAEDSVKGCAKEPEWYLGEYEVPQTSPQGIDIHKRFYTCIENVPKFTSQNGVPELTEYTDFVTPKGRKVSLQTRIDLQIEDSTLPECKGKVVVDYKTGRDVKKDEYELQAKCYIFAKGEGWKALFYSLLTNKYMVIEKMPQDYIPRVIDSWVDNIENHTLERRPNEYCQSSCPYYKQFCAPNVYFNQIPLSFDKINESGDKSIH